MGAVTSKSPLERRNTVARRSQRRTLHNLKPKIDGVLKEIKKFKGVTEDTNYVALKNEIEYLKNDLTRRGKDLQPQVRTIYENIYKKISEAEDALQNKLEENRTKLEKKENKQKENGGTAQSVVDHYDVKSDITSNVDDSETVVQIHTEQQEEQALENSEDRRKTVELKFVKVVPEEDSPKPSKEVRIVSPVEKRKSILKAGGVPVMPGAMMNELAAQSSRINRQYHAGADETPAPVTVQDVLYRINSIVESLRQLELEINDFVGRKHGKQYNRLRDGLNRYLIELNNLNPSDEYALDQVRICRNYVGSCLTFLDERSTDDARSDSVGDDEVFENNNLPPMSKIEENFRMQKLLKNTAV